MLAWIQRHIRTVMPRDGENTHCYASTKYSLTERRNMVELKMKHTCYGTGGMSQHSTCKDSNGMCKKGFDNNVLNNNKPSIDRKGFPVYGRFKDEDLKIVSYEMGMLMDCNCHCNVEYCGSTYTCVYLYKYIFKGSKKEKFRLDNADDIHDKDELNLYLRARMICSMDAAWRVMGYHTYPATNPSVTLVKVQMPEHQETYTNDPYGSNMLTDLYVYFNRPDDIEFTVPEEDEGDVEAADTNVFPTLEKDHNGKNLSDLKYTEFFELYTYGKILPKWHKDRPEMEGKKWWKVAYPNGLTNYVFKRKDPFQSIVRMQMLYSNIGELYWIRLLLLNKSCRSYEELRTSSPTRVHAKFQECAIALNLTCDETEATTGFREAMEISSPNEISWCWRL